MTTDDWAAADDALRSAVREYGTAVLSDPSLLDNVLSDLIPEADLQRNALVNAARANVSGIVSEHISHGFSPDDAVIRGADTLSQRYGLAPELCTQVSESLATALGHPVTHVDASRTEMSDGTAGPTAPAPAPVPPTVATPPTAAVPPTSVVPPVPAPAVAPVAVAPAAAPPDDGRKRRTPVLIGGAVVIVVALVVVIAVVASGGSSGKKPTAGPSTTSAASATTVAPSAGSGTTAAGSSSSSTSSDSSLHQGVGLANICSECNNVGEVQVGGTLYDWLVDAPLAGKVAAPYPNGKTPIASISQNSCKSVTIHFLWTDPTEATGTPAGMGVLEVDQNGVANQHASAAYGQEGTLNATLTGGNASIQASYQGTTTPHTMYILNGGTAATCVNDDGSPTS